MKLHRKNLYELSRTLFSILGYSRKKDVYFDLRVYGEYASIRVRLTEEAIEAEKLAAGLFVTEATSIIEAEVPDALEAEFGRTVAYADWYKVFSKSRSTYMDIQPGPNRALSLTDDEGTLYELTAGDDEPVFSLPEESHVEFPSAPATEHIKALSAPSIDRGARPPLEGVLLHIPAEDGPYSPLLFSTDGHRMHGVDLDPKDIEYTEAGAFLSDIDDVVVQLPISIVEALPKVHKSFDADACDVAFGYRFPDKESGNSVAQVLFLHPDKPDFDIDVRVAAGSHQPYRHVYSLYSTTHVEAASFRVNRKEMETLLKKINAFSQSSYHCTMHFQFGASPARVGVHYTADPSAPKIQGHVLMDSVEGEQKDTSAHFSASYLYDIFRTAVEAPDGTVQLRTPEKDEFAPLIICGEGWKHLLMPRKL